MIDFIQYIVSDLRAKRLSKSDALELIRQFSQGTGKGSVLHPLLHTNTSNFSRQSYASVFIGDEFYLADHQVRTDGSSQVKVLPGVAYLEMARVAIEQAWTAPHESMTLQLQNIVWVQPMVVSESKHVTVLLVPDEKGNTDFEINSANEGDETVHCKGCGGWIPQLPPHKLDLAHLKGQMGHGRFEPEAIYATCARMGVMYGPSFQAITGIDRGSRQVLAHLRLPSTLEHKSGDYVLHPSLMDAALQACVALMDVGSDEPLLPFALETLSILSPCAREMAAWVRYGANSKPGDNVIKIDIDLCDDRGHVCVQMRGFSSRVLSLEHVVASPTTKVDCLLAGSVWQASSQATADESTDEYAERSIILCELPKIDLEELQSLVGHSLCTVLNTVEEKNIAQRYTKYALACFERVQSILQSKPQGKVLVQIVAPDDTERALLAGLSGLLKTAGWENPRIVGQLILTSAETLSRELDFQLKEEHRFGRDAVVRYRQGTREVLAWEELSLESEPSPIAFKQDGVYLITGGLGGLGLIFAKEILARTSAARVVLTGRSELSLEKQRRMDALPGEGSRVLYRQVDLGDLASVQTLVSGIEEEHGRLDGILHSAGMIADNFIVKKSVAEFREVLAPKVEGTYHLDQATRDLELDFFVLFSSVAGAMGNVGQADYATANAFLDHFAAYRNTLVAAQQRRGRTRSINWGLWQAGGMNIDAATKDRLRKTTGFEAMRTSTGISAFYRCLNQLSDRALVVEGDLERMRRTLRSETIAPSALQAGNVPGSAKMDVESLGKKTQDYLRRQCSDLLKLPVHKIDPQAALEKYGIDSILAMKLTMRLEETFGSLSKTLFFEYQTLAELTGYFLANYTQRLTDLLMSPVKPSIELTVSAPQPPPPTRKKPAAIRHFSRPRDLDPVVVAESEAIAMIGLSGRYPEAMDLESYWRNVRDGKDCIVEVPKERWEWREYFTEDRTRSGHHYSKWGGFIAGVDEFDPLFFSISPADAEYIDPQERLFLQHAYMAIEDAGYTRASLQLPCEQDQPGQVGVYVGVMYSEYQMFGVEASLQGKRMGVAGNPASIANRVSYAFNLHGPSMTVDTMCSSSLTAIHLACQDLKQRRTSLAIAGGVNVSIHPNKYLVLSGGQFISSDGHCQSFGEGGGGYIPGEGVGVVVLKRLSEAQRDGDHIYGVIRGSALNHGGKTNGYTVPNPQAQASVISRALVEAKIDARHVSYIEAHGTGTKLGDPIEIAALSKAFQRSTQETGFCRIGSVKSNIGHCESAAGIAGLTKVLLQLQHRQIAPSLHSAQLNPHIDFAKSPFVVNQQLCSWDHLRLKDAGCRG